MKEKIKLSGVPETMLQTIYARAKESGGRGTIHDTKAEEIVGKLDYDFTLAEKDTAMHSGVIARTIVLEPEKALSEIRRVLKDDGVLVAPTFTHADNAFFGKVKAFFMKLAGFPLHSKWTSADYLSFLRENGWTVRKSTVLKASFPLTYAECVKSEG